MVGATSTRSKLDGNCRAEASGSLRRSPRGRMHTGNIILGNIIGSAIKQTEAVPDLKHDQPFLAASIERVTKSDTQQWLKTSAIWQPNVTRMPTDPVTPRPKIMAKATTQMANNTELLSSLQITATLTA